MEQLSDNKKSLRKWAKEIRSKLDVKALSMELVKKLQQTEEYENAKNVMIFYPLKDEINLLELMEDRSKKFYLPKIDGNNLLCCEFNKDTELCESCFHTKEPVIPSPQLSPLRHGNKNYQPDLVVVPALAVDKSGYRLGYGGGFYDRYLGQFSEKNCPKTIVCIPKMLIVETIFHNEHDIKIDKVITA